MFANRGLVFPFIGNFVAVVFTLFFCLSYFCLKLSVNCIAINISSRQAGLLLWGFKQPITVGCTSNLKPLKRFFPIKGLDQLHHDKSRFIDMVRPEFNGFCNDSFFCQSPPFSSCIICKKNVS